MGNSTDFVIENGVLEKYKGKGGDVVIPNGVTHIEDRAFEECIGLTSVTIPDGVSSIGEFVFGYNINLTSVTIPDSVTSIGAAAFNGCEKLADADGLVIVWGTLFDYYGKGGDVVIPEGVTRIGSFAFFGCGSITSVSIPDSVTSIEGSAFEDCTSLTSIIIPDSVKRIGYFAFANCTSLTSVTLPDSLTEIRPSAFLFCRMLRQIHCSEKVMELVADNLSGYFDEDTWKAMVLLDTLPLREEKRKTLLSRIMAKNERRNLIPKWIRADDAACLDKMLSLWKRPDYEELNGYLELAEKEKKPQMTALLLNYKASKFTAERQEEIERALTEKELGLRERSLADWRKLFKITPIREDTAAITGYKGTDMDVVIPETAGNYLIVRIRENAFDRSDIRSVTIPGSVRTIGSLAFYRCRNLKSVMMHSGVICIESRAFYRCYNLTNVHIPISAKRIGSGVFAGCGSPTIYAPKGSYSEAYAKQNGIRFAEEEPE